MQIGLSCSRWQEPPLGQTTPLHVAVFPASALWSVHTALPSLTTHGPYAQRTEAQASTQIALPCSRWQEPPLGQTTPLHVAPPATVVSGRFPSVVSSSLSQLISKLVESNNARRILFMAGPFDLGVASVAADAVSG